MSTKRRITLTNITDRLPGSTCISHRGEDPWVIYWQGHYYYCREYDDRLIMVHKAKKLRDIRKNSKIVYTDPRNNSAAELWAPELHRINNRWYIYFTSAIAPNNHRMYVLEGQTDDPQGSYLFRGEIQPVQNVWGIDGTVFTWNQTMYYVWSGWENNTDQTQNLYIQKMTDPLTLEGTRVCISRPDNDWEKQGAPTLPHINEGPQVLMRDNKLFIIYSASHSLTDDYCLGQLQLTESDPLNPAHWHKHPEPVFARYGKIYGPGHASFIQKPNGKYWIVYHATSSSNAGWDARILRAQPFSWHKDGTPNFGRPFNSHTERIIENLTSRLKKY